MLNKLLLLLVMSFTILSTSFGQTATDRLNYINRMNSRSGDKMKFAVEERTDAPYIIMTFNLAESPDGILHESDIPFFVEAADWDTFGPMFDLGFVWICFDQINLCYDREKIIDMIWPKNK